MPRSTLIRFCALLALATSMLGLHACGQVELHGTVLDPPTPAPDFTLVAHTGAPFRLSEQRGKVVLLFFGFTNCPDVCPTALSDIAAVQRKLGSDAEQVQVAFVTLDPERDTPARLAKYMAAFNPRFLGLHGTQAEIAPIIKAYGVTMARRELPNSALKYTIDHSPFIYVIDKTGSWRELLQDGVPIADMANDIRYFIHNGG